MTLEQILSPAVMDWFQENGNLPKEQMIKEFDNWLVNNEEKINESVRNNIEEINECINMGCERSRLLLETSVYATDDDEEDEDDDNFLKGITFNDGDGDADDVDDTEDEPISGKTTDSEGPLDIKTLLANPESITKRHVLTSDIWEGDKSKSNNIYDVINSVYFGLEKRKITNNRNSALWEKFNVSKVKDMTALFAFADIKNADLSSWDVSRVESMEGMFYKSSFNNDSIHDWQVIRCTNFKRMFAYCKFKGSVSHWNTGYIFKPELDSDGKPIPGKKVRVQVDPPIVGANEDEEIAMLNKYWDDVLSSLPLDESKNNENNKAMKHILDYETFINEGFGDFVKKGIGKIKSFFKDMAIKINHFVAMFDKNGKVVEATSPYTSLNYISNGNVAGVTAFTAVKNEFIDDSVKSTASIEESNEYYGIIDENSIEYKNYLTMIEMINEHCTKYGDKLNEARVGFTAADGGLQGNNTPDISTKQFKKFLDLAIRSTPGEMSKLDFNDDEEIPNSGALIIFGSPGVGKSTIPKAIIKEWNRSNETDKKAIMVVECGDLTIDGFSLPIPTQTTLRDYLNEHPEVKRRSIEAGTYDESDEYLDKKINVSTEAIKTWLPCFKKTNNEKEMETRNNVANGHILTGYKKGRLTSTETTEGGILLFDEFFRANEQIFKILMQIVLNRSFNNGEYLLGDKWAIVCCSNRPNDDKQVKDSIKDSPGATLGTRFGGGIYNFIPDFEDWKKWALKEGHFDDLTIQFLMQEKDPNNKEYTNWHSIEGIEGASKNKLGYPTPRTWAALMNELYIITKLDNYSSYDQIPEDLFKIKAEGIIGKEMAGNYIAFLNANRQSQIRYSEILNNADYVIPKKADSSCPVVVRNLCDYICSNFDDENLPQDKQMVNVFKFINKTYSVEAQGNILKPFFATIFVKLGFLDNKDGFLQKLPKFMTLFMKQYGINSGDALTKFVEKTPTVF